MMIIEGWDTQVFSIKQEDELSVFDTNDLPKALKFKPGRYIIHSLSKQEETMDNDVFKNLSGLELLTLSIYGEARGEGLDGMLAVGSVVINRVNNPSWWGNDVKQVLLKPAQFSCFMPDDPNRNTLETIAVEFKESLNRLNTLRHCYWIAKGLLDGFLSTNVGNANHYFSRHMRVNPAWAEKMTFIKQLGNHMFYEG